MCALVQLITSSGTVGGSWCFTGHCSMSHFATLLSGSLVVRFSKLFPMWIDHKDQFGQSLASGVKEGGIDAALVLTSLSWTYWLASSGWYPLEDENHSHAFIPGFWPGCGPFTKSWMILLRPFI